MLCMMKYYVTGAIVLVIIVGGGYYFLHHAKGTPAPVVETPQPVQPMQAATSTYATTTFSVVYPSDYTLDQTYVNTQVNPKKPIHGLKFTIPMRVATGTNLSNDTYISIESLPRAKICTGDIYLAANVKPLSFSENGVQYSVATSSDAGAGNLYEETVYAFAGSSPCTAVRYFIHSTQLANYPTGTVQAFDRSALLNAFDTIRRSIVFTH
jgi:hypothetical protein